jgi:hypothetical protein
LNDRIIEKNKRKSDAVLPWKKKKMTDQKPAIFFGHGNPMNALSKMLTQVTGLPSANIA